MTEVWEQPVAQGFINGYQCKNGRIQIHATLFILHLFKKKRRWCFIPLNSFALLCVGKRHAIQLKYVDACGCNVTEQPVFLAPFSPSPGIRQLQLMLLKVSLILGVEIHVNVEFVKLLEPPEQQTEDGESSALNVTFSVQFYEMTFFCLFLGEESTFFPWRSWVQIFWESTLKRVVSHL